LASEIITTIIVQRHPLTITIDVNQRSQQSMDSVAVSERNIIGDSLP